MQYLPSFLCQMIDAVAFELDPTEWGEDWDSWKADFQGYYERESDYALSDDDQHLIDNLPPLLDALESVVERTLNGEKDLEELIKASVAFFEAHDKFYNEHERLYFVRSGPMDRLIKASIAYLQGRGSSLAIHRREVDAALAVDVIHTIFESAHRELPENFNQGMADGFRRAQKAFFMLADHPDELPKEIVEEAVFELQSAGELLEHLPNLMNRFQGEHGSIVPVMGEALSALRSNPHDEELISILRDEVLPSFLEMYDTRQDGWLLEPEIAHELLDEANQGITQFQDLTESYPDNQEEFWLAVDQLEETFTAFREHTMQLENLRASPYWPEAQMLLNLLRGGAPRYAASTFVASVKAGDAPEPIRNLGQYVSDYLKDSDPVFLLAALKELRNDLELSKTTRPCSHCGKRIALDAKVCPSCQTKVEEFSLSG